MTEQDGSAPLSIPQLSREPIMQATARCLRQEGYDATTIRRIARELNCAVGSIYRYFRDKRELLFAVTQGTLDSAERVASAGASLEDGMAAYHRAASDNPGCYRLMFWLASAGETETTGPDVARAVPLPPVVQRIVAAWAGQLGDAEAAARCWVQVHGAVLLGQPCPSPASATAPVKARPAAATVKATMMPSITPVEVTVPAGMTAAAPAAIEPAATPA